MTASRLRHLLSICFTFLLLAIIPLPADADWRVIPIRLDFDQKTRSGVVTLSNDGDEAIAFTVDAVEWSQDKAGIDRYTPSEDLVFFPKAITVPPTQERVVRVGIKAPAIQRDIGCSSKRPPNSERPKELPSPSPSSSAFRFSPNRRGKKSKGKFCRLPRQTSRKFWLSPPTPETCITAFPKSPLPARTQAAMKS